MSLFGNDDVDLSKIKPIPYEDDEQSEEDDAPPLNDQQKAYIKKVAAQSAIGGLVSDALDLHPDLPPALPEQDKQP